MGLQVNAGNPSPTPTPTPAPANNNNKLGNLANSIAGLHKDVFGFQALDSAQDTSGAVLPVTAETGVSGQDINAAGTSELSSTPGSCASYAGISKLARRLQILNVSKEYIRCRRRHAWQVVPL